MSRYTLQCKSGFPRSAQSGWISSKVKVGDSVDGQEVVRVEKSHRKAKVQERGGKFVVVSLMDSMAGRGIGEKIIGEFDTREEAQRAADQATRDETREVDSRFAKSFEPGTRVKAGRFGTGTIVSRSSLGSTYQVKFDNGLVSDVAADKIEESKKAWDKGYTAGATGRAKAANPFSDTKYKVDVVKPKEDEDEEEEDEVAAAAEEEEAADTEGNTAGDADSSSEVRSPTSTSTEAETTGNITVTGGAGEGATTTVTIEKLKRKWEQGWQQGQHDMSVEQQTKRLMGIVE